MINPKDIIEKFTVEELCQTADSYFKAIPDPDALILMAKPFVSFIEAPAMLQNMGLLLSGLHLAKTMTVLDFAAGTCWFSRYLNQAQCITISCDASKTALEIGKRLFKEFPIIGNPIAEPQFLHFDGHKIDLPDESVDRIMCHDGLHHIPNQEEVIAELARVLKTGGIAGFCEPGQNHSQSAAAQYEMKNYNVLENDIFIAEIFAIAQKYGFTDIKLKLLSDMDVSLPQHQLLISKNQNPELMTSSKVAKQPFLKICSQLIHVITNIKKASSDLLTRESELEIRKVEMANGIINHIADVMTDKTIFSLYKGEFVSDSRSHSGLAHSISIEETLFFTKVGEDLTLSLRISNTGVGKWLNENIHDIGVVKIGTHLYDESGNLLNFEFSRHCIASVTAPGEAFEQIIKVRFSDAGVFKLSVDLVSERVSWFELVGSKPQLLTVNVA